MQLGSKGVISDTLADNITATPKVIGFTDNRCAVSIATGSTTSAAAAFDNGCVRKTVRMTKPAMIAISPKGNRCRTS